MGKMFDALQKLERDKIPDSKAEKNKRSNTSQESVLNDKLVSFFAPSSMVTEQFRRLRTHLIKPGVTDGPKTIMITGAMSGEGKSLVAVNLAIIIAVELQSHALLIDCDMRNPSISRWFGMEEEKGLSDYLVGQAEIPDLLVKTEVDKLSILCGGTVQDNPVELIGSSKMKSLLQDLKTRYNDRYIILDSSPLLATTEPTVLNEMADTILMVVKAGETPRESIQQALKLLDKNKVMGIVLNNMEFKTRALIQQNFRTNHKYYDYRYAKNHPDPTMWDKFGMVAGDIKTLLSKMIPQRKKDE
ncbi:MAG: polysaccharide biosynthesis tyrosine autokinase [Smithellaceae bacterium]